MSETTTEAAPATEATETDDANKPATEATEGAEQTEAKAEGEGGKPPATAEADPAPKPKQQPWWDKRIAVLTAKNASAEQMLAEANTRLAALEGRQAEQPAQTQAQMTQADFDRAVEQRAAEKAAQQLHQTRLNLMIETGNKEYTQAEFTAKSNTLAGMGATENKVFMDELAGADNGHKIVAYLGDNPDEAERLLALPERSLVREMLKLDAKVGQPAAAKQVSRAPAPVTPVNGGGSLQASLTDPNLPVEKWIELRNKELKARSGR